MVFRTDAELKEAYAERLKQMGQGVSIDMPVGEDGGTIDILTDREIIFCTLALTEASAQAMKSRLDFYGRFSPSWQKVVVVQNVIESSAADLLTSSGINLVDLAADPTADPDTELTKSASAKSPAQTTESQMSFDREAIYSYPALDSASGGEGWRAAILVIAAVAFLGVCGLVVSWVRSQKPQSSSIPYMGFTVSHSNRKGKTHPKTQAGFRR
ncbi:MAG: hypothetical protein WA949_10140 [Phormidesmis sp.]